ncbi:DUF721 domain-containing protein [Leekyejoonella antrihumi]|uniref:DUF721 domain-containing protein n=1 Tax=Leekyejoonella antrihumi TaxID=1660198 RepID=A0A563E7G9_9MICO|nr:DciA family protein [Leekyejoonella antrihumi]TWP38249.1 DUF721 domain-containing protein [Leekyejoonella antrihumi]
MSDETPPSDGGADDLAAARAALARARLAAQEKGFRPGAPGRRLPKAADLGTGRARQDGRDPAAVGDQLDRILVDRGWKVDVAAGSVMGRWPEIVGPDVAAHSAPTSFEEGVLVVRADSTAWATQLRLLSSTLLGRMEEAVGPDVVADLRITGPNGPSWSRGFRKVSGGRGPRDTYG